MNGSKRKRLIGLLLALIVSCLFSMVVFAAESEVKFSIDVDMKRPDSDKIYDTQICLYKVADAQVDKNGNLHMEPKKLFEDLVFDSATPDKARDLIEVLCERIKYPDSTSNPEQNLEPTAIKKAEADGKIHFKDLDAGVYLLKKWDRDEPKKLQMLPALVYLPGTDPETSEWLYHIDVTPKFRWAPDPEPTPAPSAPPTPNGKLPQTGMVQWPVPVLLLMGLALLIIGYKVLGKTKQD